ncbi:MULTISPECIES: diguanylate cyclase [unclassified Guyparkeria]|uniref:sensor domain-containing diguanylate cyclase n=1 Tax=unclassified Guyparkeria TaxID=2626246 RepID=UPI0008263AF3|nr:MULTISPECIES: diguanylate cyclase [unclassified Guyparkeria]
MFRRLIALLFLSLVVASAPVAANDAIVLDDGLANPVGESVRYFVDAGGSLSREQAWQALKMGRFEASDSPVLGFGIGAAPVWMHLRIENPAPTPAARILTVETAWLDEVGFHFRHDGRWVGEQQLGDRLPFGERPRDSTGFSLDWTFPPGSTDVLLRIATPDPMAVPLYVETEAELTERSLWTEYSYGFLYGFLVALSIYNLMLFFGMRQWRYLLYSVYLAFFLVMNISYTGHAYAWWWGESPIWAQWSQPVLMMLYASSGLAFALTFLDTRKHFPRIHRAVLGYVGVGAALLGLAILLDRQAVALLLAFTFVTLFTAIMLGLGVFSVAKGLTAARYFLLAAVSAMVGAAITALAVWGVIPFNIWTFRAVDLGMLVDATLLALALSHQFRMGQVRRQAAERLAHHDPLTDLDNRRAFYEASAPIWQLAERHERNLSVALLDLDHFKRINDRYGHACGDEVLKAIAQILKRSVRVNDKVARWGGEEIILLLPETGLDEAVQLAERLREKIEAARIDCLGGRIQVTASFGVSTRSTAHQNIEQLISEADRYLYEAKEAGRNRVCHSGWSASSEVGEAPDPGFPRRP